jgi:hypothetical protein
MEHFVTLFDKNFLTSGICLYKSLEKYHIHFILWVLCMDDEVWNQLSSYELSNIKLIKLADIETEELIAVKKERTQVEYCWTLTPFTPEIIFKREPSIERVTYIDADLYFFDSTTKIFDEFENSNCHVLITEHGYSRQYDKSEKSGIYCVQFMIFRNTIEARKVLSWWQGKCIEWCYNRCENGKCGDQKYLDDWPQRFENTIHVLTNLSLTLAPWNLGRFLSQINQGYRPTFFHFHGLRIISIDSIRLYFGYKIPKNGMTYYREYTEMLINVMAEIKNRFGSFPVLPEESNIKFFIKKLIFLLLGLVKYEKF